MTFQATKFVLSLRNLTPTEKAVAHCFAGHEHADLADPRWADLVAREIEASEQSQQEQRPPANAQEAFVQHVESIRKLAADPSINSPEMLDAFKGSLARAFGANSPESLQNVDRLSDALMVGGLNLMSTVVPKIVESQILNYLEKALPGLTEDYADRTCQKAWDSVRAEAPDLPQYGTPKFDEAYEAALAKNPWLNEVGQNLPWNQAVRARASALGKVLNGDRLSPESIRELIGIGERKATQHARKVTAGKSLGAGRSRGTFEQPKGDEFRNAILAYNRAQRSSERNE